CFIQNCLYTRAVTTNGAEIEFAEIPGWVSPTNRSVSLVAGNALNTISNVFYTPVRLLSPQLLGDGTFQLTLSGQPGRKYAMLWSPDLLTWSNLLTFTNATGLETLIDSQATGYTRRFYRAMER